MATKIWPEEVNEPWGRQRVTVVSSFPGILIFRPEWFPAVEGVNGAVEDIRKFWELSCVWECRTSFPHGNQ